MKTAFVFDLDGTLNHAETLPDGLPIRGRTTDSFMSRQALTLLLELAELTDLYVATGRSLASTADFRKHFAAAGLRISGWILEHGAIVEQHPEWQERILAGIDLADLKSQIKEFGQRNGWGVDLEKEGSHQAVLRYTVGKPEQATAFLACLSDLLNNQFRVVAEPCKIVLIPKQAEKYAAFQTVFGKTHCLCCAAGDTLDDLTLLKNAAFPLTLHSAYSPLLRLVQQRGGFAAASAGHEGTVAMLEAAVLQFKKNAF